MSKMIGGQYVYNWVSSPYNAVKHDFITNGLESAINKATSTLGVSTTDYTGIQISPDGLYTLCGSTTSPYIRVCDNLTEDWITPIAVVPTSHPLSIRFSAAGDEFAIALQGSPFVARYTYPGFVRQSDPAVTPGAQCNRVAYSPDGTKLVLAMQSAPFLKVYSVPAMVDITPAWASPPTGALYALSFSPDNDTIFVGGSAGGAGNKAYSVSTGANKFFSTTDCYATSFSPDGSKVAVALSTPAKTIRFYNASTWAVEKDISYATGLGVNVTGNSSIRHLKFFDNDYILLHAERGAAIINYTSGLQVRRTANGTASVGEACLSPKTAVRKIAGTVTDGGAGFKARKVRVFDGDTGRLVGEGVSNAETGVFEIIVFTPDLVTVVCYGESGEIAKVFGGVTPAVL